MRGWQDAAEFLEIEDQYVRDNPNQAQDTISKLKALSRLGDQKPESLTTFINRFYQRPENKSAPLSKAVSAAAREGAQ